jgi:hypothetical protein
MVSEQVVFRKLICTAELWSALFLQGLRRPFILRLILYRTDCAAKINTQAAKLRGVRATIVAVEKQQVLHIVCVCVCVYVCVCVSVDVENQNTIKQNSYAMFFQLITIKHT